MEKILKRLDYPERDFFKKQIIFVDEQIYKMQSFTYVYVCACSRSLQVVHDVR